MSYSFEEIMSFHPDNRNVYEEIKKNLPVIVPFVGAGLTQFAYYSWKGALLKLAEKITQEENHRQIEELIQSGDYLTAAQRLEDLRRPANLAQDLVHLFSAKHLDEKQSILHKQAIYLLPRLFRGLVLTTNFDETLEYVYRKCGIQLEASHPGHSELLEQLLRQTQSRGLFKFHGTIHGEQIEYESIIFTRRQYKRHYRKTSALTKDLKNCMQKRTLLFLGCSLGKDLTMDMLQKTIKRGDYYYTIINCEKTNRDDKITELGEKRIRAILYEGDRHEAVRVILEHLLEETDPEAYRLLSYHEGALPKTKIDHRFSYDAEILPLIGREDEQRELEAFLGDEVVPFRWWAVTGPGGAGKSRLAFEFQKQIRAEWKVHYLSAEEYGRLSGLSARLTGKTLLIADYVQEHARELGVWMEELNAQKRSLPLRLLLVERQSRGDAKNADGKKQVHGTDTAWEKQLYCAVRHERALRNVCFRESFLSLLPLSDGDLKEIIKAYAAAIKPWEKELSAEETELLLKKLKEIDPELCRPLYAMFLTDAFIEGMAPEHWNQKNVLDYVLEREQKRLEFRLRYIMELRREDKRLSAVCQYFLCLATVWQDAEVRKIQELCPEEWKKLQEKLELQEKPEELLEQIGMTGLVAGIEKVLALRPDLVGEYYVYDWLIRQQKETAERFLKTVWQQPFPAVIFFNRLMHDYGYLLNETPGNWEVVVPDLFAMSEEAADVGSKLLVNAIIYCMDVYQCKKMASLLERVSDKHPESAEMAVIFAKGLVNLSNKKEKGETKEAVARLEKLTGEHPESKEIALEFAKGLFNLSCDQEERGAKETVTRLEKLTGEHLESAEIALEFAKGLMNLINKQEEREAKETAARLEKLTGKHPESKEIALEFAKGLVNLTSKQEERGAKETVARLEKLTRKHLESEEIALVFAKGLMNLTNRQEERGAKETLDRLEKLAGEHPERADIALEFAKGLMNLTNKQVERGAKETVARLEKLTRKHLESKEIALEFAKGLMNLTNRQEERGAKETVDRLENLTREHQERTEIALEFAKGLMNLTNKQEERGAKETVARLEKLTRKHPESEEISLAFAKCLMNLTNRQEERGAKETVDRLEKLTGEHPERAEIALEFAKGLMNLSNKQGERGAKETVDRLEKLNGEHSESAEIALEFAKGLVNLSNKQGERGAKGTVDRLEKLTGEYPERAEIALVFAKGLLYLSCDQEERGARETVDRLEKLTGEYPERAEIALEFAKGLFYLSCDQEEKEALTTVTRLEKLAGEHPDIPEIVEILKMAKDSDTR